MAMSSGGNVSKLYKKAKQFYIDKKLPFNYVDLRKAIKPEKLDVDTLVTKFIKPDRPELAKKLISQLDKEGLEALQYGILNNALLKSTDIVKGLNPQKFVKEVDKLNKVTGKVFSKKVQDTFDGFKNIVKAVEETSRDASLAGRLVPGGGATFGAGGIILGLATGSAAIPVVTTAVVATISKLLTTKAGVKLLTRAKDLDPASLQMRDVLRKLNDAVIATIGAQKRDIDQSRPPKNIQ